MPSSILVYLVVEDEKSNGQTKKLSGEKTVVRQLAEKDH